WWMTKNQCSGGMEDGSDNLKPDYFEAFADYLTDVTKHLQDSSGFRFRTLEPLNESSSNWWTGTSQAQEGCGFANNQAKLMKTLAVEIKAKNLAIGVSAADENSISLALSGLQKYDDSALSILAQLNTHSYSGWDKRKEYGQKAISLKKRLWMSESGPLNRPAGGDLLDVSLWMADMIIKDVKEMQANAWIDWQLIDASANWRSIDANQTAQSFAPNKRFYMHCNFSRFIRPGSKILQSPAENTLAALVPETGNLVVVVLNPETAARNYIIDLSLFPGAAPSGSVYSTNATDNLKKLADIPVQGGGLTAAVSAKSITTFVIKVANPSGLSTDSREWQDSRASRDNAARSGKAWRMRNGNGAGPWPAFPWEQWEFDAQGRMLGHPLESRRLE
ncbi:MAG: glycoside hydrolase, partial [Fibrobacteria bacterium]